MTPHGRGRQGGFTFVELMTVLFVIGILAAIAMPSFQGVLVNQRLASTASDLVSALNSARNEAIKKAETVRVAPIDDDWNQGWTVQTVGDLPMTLRSYEKLETGIERDTSLGNGFSNAVTYDSNGFARDADGRFGGSGCLTFKSIAQRRISVVVSASGRPRSCDPDKTGDCGSGECSASVEE